MVITETQLLVVRSLRKEERYLKERIDELNTELYSLSSPSLEPSYGSNGDDKATALIENRDNLKQTLIEKRAIILQLENEVEEAITILTSEERMAIRLYYLKGMEWEIVAEEMKYSKTRIFDFRQSALKKLQDRS